MRFYQSEAVLCKHKQCESTYHDEVNGFSIELSTFYNTECGMAKCGTRGTPMVLYVIGTNTPRVGTDSDTEIVSSMLERGYIVTVADFGDNAEATSPRIDWTINALVQKVKDAEHLEGDFFEAGHYHNTYIVPSGHNLSIGNVFWQIDRHSVVGTMEKIVYNWNTDLRGCKGEFVIPWVHKDGTRKQTQADFEGNAPVWYADPEGQIVDPKGTYIRLKHTKAERITDCVRPDGEPIDLNLYMQIVYPTNPKEPVPVIVQASSSEHLANGVTMNGRPHTWSFAFSGYASVAYDYAYVPMVRNDHYGYYDGYKWKGYKTGDNMTYSVYTYNMQMVSSAAIRYLRMLSYTGKYSFTDMFGIVGNSKGSEMTHLGDARLMQTLSLSDGYTESTLKEAVQKKICTRPTRFYMPDHHGETRYEMQEKGYTADGIVIHDGEIQPWLTYGGKEIPSGVQFVYSCCGAIVWTMDEGYCPMYISGSMGHGETAAYTRQNEVVNLTRESNIPLIYFESMTGHGLIPNEHHIYPEDPYLVYKNFVKYFLSEGNVTIGYVNPVEKENLPRTTVPAIHFAGVVREEEAKRITLTDSTGKRVPCRLSSKWGDTYWEFQPEYLAPDMTYTLFVPADLRGANGKEIGTPYTHTFTTKKETVSPVAWERTALRATEAVALALAARADKISLLLTVESEGGNAIEFFSSPDCTKASLLATVPVSGCGKYAVELPSVPTVYVRQKREGGEYPHPIEGAYALAPIGTGYGTVTDLGGTPEFRVAVGKTQFNLGHATYGIFPTLIYKNLIGKPLEKEDYGRRFRFDFRLTDTVSRQIVAVYSSLSNPETGIIDYHVARRNYTTKAGEAVDCSLNITLYHPMYGESGLGEKHLTFHVAPTGDTEIPVCFSNLTLTETVSDTVIVSMEEIL